MSLTARPTKWGKLAARFSFGVQTDSPALPANSFNLVPTTFPAGPGSPGFIPVGLKQWMRICSCSLQYRDINNTARLFVANASIQLFGGTSGGYLHTCGEAVPAPASTFAISAAAGGNIGSTQGVGVELDEQWYRADDFAMFTIGGQPSNFALQGNAVVFNQDPAIARSIRAILRATIEVWDDVLE